MADRARIERALMNIEVSYRDLNRSERTDELVEQKVLQAIGAHEERITRVEVHLGDHNGHKGGADDIRCMMEARLRGKQPIVVEANAEKIAAAIAHAADKLGTAVQRRVEKARDHGRDSARVA